MPMLQQAAGANPQLAQQMAQATKAPVDPNIGTVDVTTPEGQANPNTVATPTSVEGAVATAREGQGQSLQGEEQQATPEEQAEYERALEAVHQVLYEDPERSASIAGMIQPQDKIGSVVKTGVSLIKQIDEQVDMDQNVVAQITVDLADRLIELAETAHNITFSEQELKAVAGATWEGVMDLFGFDQQSVQEMTAGMTPEDLKGYENQYKGFQGEGAE